MYVGVNAHEGTELTWITPQSSAISSLLHLRLELQRLCLHLPSIQPFPDQKGLWERRRGRRS